MTAAPSALAVLDSIARHFVRLNGGFRFGIAQTPAECEAVFRLRYREVIERGWVTPESLPDGLERDEYDVPDTLHIVVWDGDRLAATTRIVQPLPGRRLPTEAAFDLAVEPAGQVVDAGRTIIAPPYRHDREHKLLMGLIGQSWLELRARGYTNICATLSPAIIQLYDRIGFHATILGTARQIWSEDRYPVLFDLTRTAEAIRQRFPDMHLR